MTTRKLPFAWITSLVCSILLGCGGGESGSKPDNTTPYPTYPVLNVPVNMPEAVHGAELAKSADMAVNLLADWIPRLTNIRDAWLQGSIGESLREIGDGGIASIEKFSDGAGTIWYVITLKNWPVYDGLANGKIIWEPGNDQAPTPTEAVDVTDATRVHFYDLEIEAPSNRYVIDGTLGYWKSAEQIVSDTLPYGFTIVDSSLRIQLPAKHEDIYLTNIEFTPATRKTHEGNLIEPYQIMPFSAIVYDNDFGKYVLDGSYAHPGYIDDELVELPDFFSSTKVQFGELDITASDETQNYQWLNLFFMFREWSDNAGIVHGERVSLIPNDIFDPVQQALESPYAIGGEKRLATSAAESANSYTVDGRFSFAAPGIPMTYNWSLAMAPHDYHVELSGEDTPQVELKVTRDCKMHERYSYVAKILLRLEVSVAGKSDDKYISTPIYVECPFYEPTNSGRRTFHDVVMLPEFPESGAWIVDWRVRSEMEHSSWSLNSIVARAVSFIKQAGLPATFPNDYVQTYDTSYVNRMDVPYWDLTRLTQDFHGEILAQGIRNNIIPAEYKLNLFGSHYHLEDLNGDGNLDIVYYTHADYENDNKPLIAFSFAEDGGTYRQWTDFLVESGTKFLVAEDVNGDGSHDVVINTNCGLQVFLANGTYSMQMPISIHTVPTCAGANQSKHIAIAQLGETEQATIITGFPDDNGLYIVDLDGDGNVIREEILANPTPVNGIEVIDIDMDGRKDIVTFHEQSLYVNTQAADGSFEPATSIEMGSRIRTIRTGDIDGDDKLELIIGKEGLGMLGGIFAWKTTVSGLELMFSHTSDPSQRLAMDYPGFEWRFPVGDIVVGDLNGDGADDIVASESTGQVRQMITRDFEHPGFFKVSLIEDPRGDDASSIVYSITDSEIIDFDKDGQNDIVSGYSILILD